MTQQGTPLARLLGRFLPALEGAGIRSCVLRGYEGLPEATRNDVDLAVEPGSGQRAEHWLRRAAEETRP